MLLLNNVIGIAIFILLLLIIAISHELGHGYMAYMLGDETAKRAGRLSWNPLRHIDPFGTIILPVLLYFTVGFPLIMFKPVPINPLNFKNPTKDGIKVALAGPGANLLLIIIVTTLFYLIKMVGGITYSTVFKIMIECKKYLVPISEIIKEIIRIFIIINFIIMAFNLLPIPPLDGSWVIRGILPVRWRYYFQKGYTYFIIFFIVLFITGGFHHILEPAFRYLIKLGNYLIR